MPKKKKTSQTTDTLCAECNAKCCRYFCFEIDEPDDYDEFEDIRWYLMHEDVTIHIDEGRWYMSIANKCKNLGPDNRCTIYETRPTICRSYDTDGCDHTGGGYDYEEYFTTPEQIERYARKTLGAETFDNERAKAWGLKNNTKKKKTRAKKRKKS